MHDARCFGFALAIWVFAGCSSDASENRARDAEVTEGDGAILDADASCVRAPVEGWNCPASYSADPAELCGFMPNQHIHLGDNGTSRNLTFNVGIGAWGCCYDASGALTGEHIRDDLYHECWGPNGTSSNETDVGQGCWIAVSNTPIDCAARDAGAPDAEPTDLAPMD